MTRPVIGRGMYGMWGPLTDLGEREREFTDKVASLGVDIGKSLYRDYQVNEIAADLNAAPPDAVLIVWGFSLGSNNCPVVARLVHRNVHGIWGFQASDDGAKVPITPNVLFAHEVYNPAWLGTAGLGHYEWELAPNNHVTNLYLSKRWDMHPGATERTQAMFLAEIERVIAKPGD